MKKILLIIMGVAKVILSLAINAFGVILIYETSMMISIQGFSETLDGILAISLTLPLIIGFDALLLYAYLESKEDLEWKN